MNVFLYVRVSTEEQSRSGLSLETQEKALKEYCEQNSHTIIDVYRDAGFSARKPYNKRPEMMRLINDLEDRKPQKILFTKLDRWFRNIREYYKVQEILDAHDVAWSAIWENYNTDTASGRLHVNIMLSVAQDESDRTSERIKSIHHAAIMRGQPISGIQPIGFKVDVIDGNITKEQYRQRTKVLKDKIAELNRSDHGSLQLSKLKNLLTGDFERDYNLLDREYKRSFWRQLIKQIVVDFNGHPVDVIFLD